MPERALPDQVRTLQWPQVRTHYEDRVAADGRSFEPMLSLVRFLASSRYASALFPCPSDDVLRIGKAPDFTAGDNEIRIRFLAGSQQFEFSFFQRPDEMHPWSRECGASEWQPVLLRLLHKRLQWFHEG
jgi:hypothetical protein